MGITAVCERLHHLNSLKLGILPSRLRSRRSRIVDPLNGSNALPISEKQLPRFNFFSLFTASIHANIPAISPSANLDPSRGMPQQQFSPGHSQQTSGYSPLISVKSISSHKFSSCAFLADKIIFVIADGLFIFSLLLLDDDDPLFFFLNHVKIDLGDDLH